MHQKSVDEYISIIAELQKKIKDQENIINSLKLEVRTQRKEIAVLREERRKLIDDDKPPGYYNGLWEIDEKIY